MKNDIFKSPAFKKILGVASIAVAGVVGVVNALSDQKKEKEFEEMKQDVSELKKKMGES